MIDICVPGLVLGQVIGRWGNFTNREVFGEYTESLLAMRLPTQMVRAGDISEKIAAHMAEGANYIQVHPTFLYESLWNLALLIVPPAALVLVFRQWLARHIRWTVALTALCDVLLFWDELFYYESFGLFAVLILVQLAATGAAAFRIYNKQRKD